MDITEDEMQKYTIAQDDDCDYSESGYVAVVKDGVAALSRYGHCSCFRTHEAIGGNWDWEGSIEQLVEMATRKADPSIPERAASPEDFDYDHLCRVYEQILEWNKNRENN